MKACIDKYVWGSGDVQATEDKKSEVQAPRVPPSPFLHRSKSVVPSVKGLHSRGCLMALLPDQMAQEVLCLGQAIPDSQLGPGGREKKPHVTVKYGLVGSVDLKELKSLLIKHGPIPVRLGGLSLFGGWNNEDGEVLKLDLESASLRELNSLMSNSFPCEDAHPEYHPHITVAYLKPEFSQFWAGQEFPLQGQEFLLEWCEYSSASGAVELMPLAGSCCFACVGGMPCEGEKAFTGKKEDKIGWTQCYSLPSLCPVCGSKATSFEGGWRCGSPPCEWSLTVADPREAIGTKSVESDLRKVCESFHDIYGLGPDYQRLFWNPETKTAWWESFDGDEEEGVREVQRRLEKVRGVEKVEVEAEASPRNKLGWVEIKYKSLPDYFIKSQGQPCEQGEAASKTGCIPASGDASAAPEKKPEQPQGITAKGKQAAWKVINTLSPASILQVVKQSIDKVRNPRRSVQEARHKAVERFKKLQARYGTAGACAIAGAYAGYYVVATLNPRIMLFIPSPSMMLLASAEALRYGWGKLTGTKGLESGDLLEGAREFIQELAREHGEEAPELDWEVMGMVLERLHNLAQQGPTPPQVGPSPFVKAMSAFSSTSGGALVKPPLQPSKENPADGPYLFVYGTLKQGHQYHGFLKGEDFIGPIATEPGYSLQQEGSFPALKLGHASVQGELYRVDPRRLEQLKEWEDHYQLEPVKLQGFAKPALAFFWNKSLEHQAKGQGQPCKPGESASRVGCIPASGGAAPAQPGHARGSPAPAGQPDLGMGGQAAAPDPQELDQLAQAALQEIQQALGQVQLPPSVRQVVDRVKDQALQLLGPQGEDVLKAATASIPVPGQGSQLATLALALLISELNQAEVEEQAPQQVKSLFYLGFPQYKSVTPHAPSVPPSQAPTVAEQPKPPPTEQAAPKPEKVPKPSPEAKQPPRPDKAPAAAQPTKPEKVQKPDAAQPPKPEETPGHAEAAGSPPAQAAKPETTQPAPKPKPAPAITPAPVVPSVKPSAAASIGGKVPQQPTTPPKAASARQGAEDAAVEPSDQTGPEQASKVSGQDDASNFLPEFRSLKYGPNGTMLDAAGNPANGEFLSWNQEPGDTLVTFRDGKRVASRKSTPAEKARQAPEGHQGQQSKAPVISSREESSETTNSRGSTDFGIPADEPLKEFVPNPRASKNEVAGEKEFRRGLKTQYPTYLPCYHEAPIEALDSIIEKGISSVDSINGDISTEDTFATIGESNGFVSSSDKLIVKFKVGKIDYDDVHPDMMYDPDNPGWDLLKEHDGVFGSSVAIGRGIPVEDIESITVIRDGKVVDTITDVSKHQATLKQEGPNQDAEVSRVKESLEKIQQQGQAGDPEAVGQLVHDLTELSTSQLESLKAEGVHDPLPPEKKQQLVQAVKRRMEQAAQAKEARRVPAHQDEVDRRLDRYEKLFQARAEQEPEGETRGSQHFKQAEWMKMLREHIAAVGIDDALASLGKGGKSEDGRPVQYGGGWDDMGHFAESYLNRNGIIPDFQADTEFSEDVAYLSSQPNEEVRERGRPGDFTPSLPTVGTKLDEAKHLPGLETSEDLSVIMGKPVTHLTPEVFSKLDEKYGEGGWIVKNYGEAGYAGFGIYFPQRARKVEQDAKNAIWESGTHLAEHGLSYLRDDSGTIVGLENKEGREYLFGTEEYDASVQGDAREWADKAEKSAKHERGAWLPVREGFEEEGRLYMAQPAFPVAGVSDADREAGKTHEGTGEGRVHVITRNGKAEVVPYATWIKGERLPVVFENEDTKAMAQAAQEAIDALPESERQGQIYAPDVVRTKDGFKVVEANPATDDGASGWLGNSPFAIDAYVSHLLGREPAHAQFIRKLLTSRQKQTDQEHLVAEQKEAKDRAIEAAKVMASNPSAITAESIQDVGESLMVMTPDELANMERELGIEQGDGNDEANERILKQALMEPLPDQDEQKEPNGARQIIKDINKGRLEGTDYPEPEEAPSKLPEIPPMPSEHLPEPKPIDGEVTRIEDGPIADRIKSAKHLQDAVQQIAALQERAKAFLDVASELDAEVNEMHRLVNDAHDAWTRARKKGNKEGWRRRIEALRRHSEAVRKRQNDYLTANRSVIDQARKHLQKIAGVKDQAPFHEHEYESGMDASKPNMDAATAFLSPLVGKSRGFDLVRGYRLYQAKNEDGTPNTRANYSEFGNKINGGSNFVLISTLLHEMAHGLEAMIPGAERVCRDFINYRCKGEPFRSLDEIFPGYGYDKDEKGRKDNFDKLYGNGSRAYYVGKIGPLGGTEVLSMGVELLYEDPARFAAIDPEYFTFVLGVLRGELREQYDPNEFRILMDD